MILSPSLLADAQTAPWWSHIERGVFTLPRCEACGLWHFHPQPRCPHCGRAEIAWRPASGWGQVHSFTIVHRAPSPAFSADVPYVIAIVATDEGPHLMSRLVGVAPGAVSIGLPVQARVDRLSQEGPLLVLFEPRAAE